MKKDVNDRLNTYERPFHKKSRTRSLRFLLPRVGLILLVALFTLTIAESAYGCQGNNGGGNGGKGAKAAGKGGKGDKGAGNGAGNDAGNGGSNNKSDNQRGVSGQVGLAVQALQLNSVRASVGGAADPAANLTVKLNLQNVPQGKHKADIHQGTCPLNFTLNGQPSPFGPFTPDVTLPLGLIQAKANGTLKQTLKFQVGGTTGIPANILQSGNWFFCIHTGTLAQVTGNTPAQKFASLQKFEATPKGASQIQQLVCQALNAPQGTNNLTLNFQGGQPEAASPANSVPPPAPTPGN